MYRQSLALLWLLPLIAGLVLAQEATSLIAGKCLTCHSDQVQMSSLALTSRDAVLKGGARGPAAKPGDPEASLLIEAVRYEGDLKMPPTGKLSEAEIDTLERWVAEGMEWKSETVTTSGHWSFQPVKRSPLPEVRNRRWARNAIDHFVLARLEKEAVEPSPEADKRTLIRRVSLDLTGLPPTPEEVAAFLGDKDPGAYDRVVDRLLSSPHYGERWARHWLDVARYADSNGYNIDGPRSIWKYRDWVIDALNHDMPFDQFVIEQTAGDLLPNATQDQIVATGFHRNTLLNLEGGIDFEQYRVEAVVDRVNTTGAAFLGLTIGCARCHDHKYDPISQRDYYRLYAFFNNIDELSGEFKDREGRKRAMEPVLEFGSADAFARRDAIREQMELLEKDLDQYEKGLREKQPEWERTITAAERTKLKPHILVILNTPAEERNSFQRDLLTRTFLAMDPGYSARQKGLKALRSARPKLVSTLVMRELSTPREAYIHVQGDFLRKGEPVEPGTPSVLPPLSKNGRANRLDLARWLVDKDNPLTPRVVMNRVWQRYFGKGIVETENDFGTQGTPPSHPVLLDWLASEFIEQQWSLKRMHRLIVTSATYRQSSDHRPELAERDPSNRLLARQNRLRLEAEIIRDSALVASNLLTPAIGGPSVFPPQPAGVGRQTQVDRKWKAEEGPSRYRRGMYTYFWRSAPHPGLMLFDAPDSMTVCTRRNRSTSPLQALTLLNDEAHQEFAQALAERVLREAPKTTDERIQRGYELCLARPPKADEEAELRQFVAGMLDDFRTHPEEASAAVPNAEEGSDLPVLAAWTAAARVLLNLDEFITRE